MTRKEKHPHARGEDTQLVELVSSPLETPPRTWGRRRDHAPDTLDAGNTPTHVGKTGQKVERTTWHSKHPHARGEDGAHRRRKDV